MRKLSLQKLFCLCVAFFASYAAQSQETSDSDLRQLIRTNANRLHLAAVDIDDALINSSYVDDASGIRYLYLQQGHKSIGVFNQVITIAFKNNVVAYTSGKFITDLVTKLPSAQPTITPQDAIRRAALHLSLPTPMVENLLEDNFATEKKYVYGPSGVAKQNIEVKLVWVEEDNGPTMHLAWDVSIDVKGSQNWWNVRIDALTGEFINKNNFTVYDIFDNKEDDVAGNGKMHTNLFMSPSTLPIGELVKQNKIGNTTPPIVLQSIMNVTDAKYRVIAFPNESPYSANPSLEISPWLKAGANNRATTYGWHFDGTNYHDSTKGNNVHSYLDVANLNNSNKPNFTAKSTTPQPSLSFDFAPNFNVTPADTINRLHAITNLFYWNNLMHDVTYQYGFNEPSGNFQFTNIINEINRGGSGNDYVRAEAQDGSGTNNANFSTPADGSSGRMQMYNWSGPTTFVVNSPSSIAGTYFAKESGYSTNNKLKNIGPLSGQVVYYNDSASGATHYACGTPGAPFNSITGKIALIIRGGGCAGGFIEKAKNAQNAGAIGVIMINNIAGYPITMGGTDNTITIPGIMVSQDVGALLAAQLTEGVNVTMSAGPDRDGDLDNGVVCHEYGHGISNRLTGGRTNASCLSNAEQAGEGWSDFFGLMMTTDWTTAQVSDGPKPRPVGNYAGAYPTNGPGIRSYPYSTNMAVNPLTYADVALNTEVHATGEVWCATVWDMVWSIIQQENSISPNLYDTTGTGGNIVAMKLVMEGMRLQNCRPGFLDSRDAILAADSIFYGYRHKCAIWNAFARRGMGLSALQGLSTSAADQVQAFDVPSKLFLTRSIVASTVESGNIVTVNLKATCQCQIPATGTVRDTIPAGFTFVSSTPTGSVSGNVVSFPSLGFSNVNASQNIAIVLKATAPGCAVTTSIDDNRNGSALGGLAPTATVGTTQWADTTIRYKSSGRSWWASNVAGLRDYSLTSSAFTVGNLSVLSFWHYFVTENLLDGGRVEYTVDNGTTWLDAGPYILQNGYNESMIAASPWGAGTMAFSGVSYAQGSGEFINTLINLSSFSGKTMRIRFRMQTNATNASNQTYDGWFIDDITLKNGCGGLSSGALFTNTGVKSDSLLYPIFIVPSTGLPLNLVSFTAKAVGQTVLLNWLTKTEVNTKSFVVEHSTNGSLWKEIGTVAAKGSGDGSYLLYHNLPVEGINYYRIKMMDKDGSATFTAIRTVKFSAKGNALFTIVPNPANTTATLYIDKNIKQGTVTVFDAHGRAVQTMVVNNVGNGYQFETAKLAAGTYFVSIKTGSTTATGRLIVSH